jgi:hypothetical protein
MNIAELGHYVVWCIARGCDIIESFVVIFEEFTKEVEISIREYDRFVLVVGSGAIDLDYVSACVPLICMSIRQSP